MALGKLAMQGQGTYKLSTADKAVDGNTSEAANSGACAHTTEWSSWWKVDIGRPYLLTGIKIYNRERGSEFLKSLFVGELQLYLKRNTKAKMYTSVCIDRSVLRCKGLW